ncbi:hypothetical protein FB45DRAFT_1116714 [Roridomyces roridus]|uniref:Uncharacterized protein n=1 Tax=Roridomyces roridus TaxID=1738132 RepID=A0AAD7FYP3_9AGAR|nr:hypothetical protein FB45DRAFT_1116714 [Roridomyces roridus]
MAFVAPRFSFAPSARLGWFSPDPDFPPLHKDAGPVPSFSCPSPCELSKMEEPAVRSEITASMETSRTVVPVNAVLVVIAAAIRGIIQADLRVQALERMSQTIALDLISYGAIASGVLSAGAFASSYRIGARTLSELRSVEIYPTPADKCIARHANMTVRIQRLRCTVSALSQLGQPTTTPTSFEIMTIERESSHQDSLERAYPSAPGGYHPPPPVGTPMGMQPVYAGQVNADPSARATGNPYAAFSTPRRFSGSKISRFLADQHDRLGEQRNALVKLPKDIALLTTLFALIAAAILGVLRADIEIQKMDRGALIHVTDYVSYGAVIVNILGTAAAVLAHYRLSVIHAPEAQAMDTMELYKLGTGKTSALRLLAVLGADWKLRFLCIQREWADSSKASSIRLTMAAYQSSAT